MTAPSRDPRTARRTTARALAVATLVLACAVAGGQASAESAGPSASPSPSPSASPGASPGASPSVSPGVSPGADQPGGSPVDGTIAVGGLRASYRAEPDPFAGTLHLAVTVQNLSGEVIEPHVAFSLTSWLGVHIDAEPSRPLGRMAPGERRTAEVDLAGIGQWGLVDARMVLTPPPVIDGIEVGQVHRDRWLLAPPWLVLGVLGLVTGGLLVRRLVRRVATRVPAAAAAPVAPAVAAPVPAEPAAAAPAGAPA